MQADKAAVTVQLKDIQADVQLSIDRTVHETVRDLIPYLRSNLKSQDRPTDILDEKGMKWTLVKGVNTILDPNSTLDKAGVRRGDTLRLESTKAKETYAALIDDVPESLAEYQLSRFSSWTDRTSTLFLGGLVPTIAFTLSFVLGLYSTHIGNNLIQRIAVVGMLFTLAVIGITIAFRACKKTSKDDSREFSALGNVAASSGLILLAASGFAAVPTGVSMWNVIAACIPVFVAAAILRTATVGTEFSSYWAMVSSTIVVAGAVTSLFISNITTTGFGALTATYASTFLLFAARLAMNAANIPRPYVPTVGEDYINPNEEIRIDRLPTASSTEAIESIINREKQTVDAHNAILGMTAGGMLAIIISLCCVASSMDSGNQLIAVMFCAVVIFSMIFRGKSYDDLATQGVWSLGTGAVLVLIPVIMAVSQSSTTYLLVTCALLIVGMLFAAFYTIIGQKITSPVTLRVLEMIEFVIFVSIFILLAVILDVYGIVRYR